MVDVNRIIQRLTRMLRFDNTVYSEIEHDETANTEAAVVVLVAAFLAALGSGFASQGFILAFILRLLAGVLLQWLLWSYVTMFVGTRLFGGKATFWEMARCLGYANAPTALGLLGVIPCLGLIAGLVAFVLSLVFGFLATREALDLPTDKTIITIVIGWVIVVIIYIVLGLLGLAF
jgi:hypothetical protein